MFTYLDINFKNTTYFVTSNLICISDCYQHYARTDGQQGITIKNYSTRSLLTVTNVTEEHFGNYTCVAANKLGTTNASLPLNRK